MERVFFMSSAKAPSSQYCTKESSSTMSPVSSGARLRSFMAISRYSKAATRPQQRSTSAAPVSLSSVCFMFRRPPFYLNKLHFQYIKRVRSGQHR